MQKDNRIDIELISKILMYNKSGEEVSVFLKDGGCINGVITLFNGFMLEISGSEIKNVAVTDVDKIESYSGIDWTAMYGKRVILTCEKEGSYAVIDGVVISSDAEGAQVVTAEGLVKVFSSEVVSAKLCDSMPAQKTCGQSVPVKSQETVEMVMDQVQESKVEKQQENGTSTLEEDDLPEGVNDKKRVIEIAKTKIKNHSSNYVEFFEKHKAVLVTENTYCVEYALARLARNNYYINEFEDALIKGLKDEVLKYASNQNKLAELGYAESDIDRINKACINANWDMTMYKIASRVFLMQSNKNGVAEVFYETALLIAEKETDEYAKIINALAIIKSSYDSKKYIVFFETYINRLKKNSNYCVAFVNALAKTQDWNRYEKHISMLEQQLADKPDVLKKIKSSYTYYKQTADFSIQNNSKLSDRYSILTPDDEEQVKELTLLEKLPEKNAVTSLISYYAYREEFSLFCEVLLEFYPYVKEEINIIQSLHTILGKCEEKYLKELLPKFPVFWCDESLVKRFLATGKADLDSLDATNIVRLKNVSKIIVDYPALNEFEKAIVSDEFDKINAFIDDPQELLLMGYNDEEIRDIAMIDMDEYEEKASTTYMLRKILAFQGNKNHLAERYLFEAFYENRVDMCNRLFPLLLEEKRGDLILALLTFDPTLMEKLSSAKRMYYLALCYAECDDVFWKELESNWITYPEADIIARMTEIAQKRGESFLLKQLESKANRPKGNAFEVALIKADTEEIRKYVKNASMLVELGYTPEEITKISKVFASNTINNGVLKWQIAQRVYVYQKNKNKLAEQLFWEALATSNEEEALIASKTLYQIYIGQKNYKEVEDLYNKYLYREMIPKFNGNYAEAYAIALFELENYEGFYNFYDKHKNEWENFKLFAYLLFVSEILNKPSVPEMVWNGIFEARLRPDVVANYINLVVNKRSYQKYNTEITPIFNHYYIAFSASDFGLIKSVIERVTFDGWECPAANGIKILTAKDIDDKLVYEWFEYLKEKFDITERIKMLFKMNEACEVEADVLVQCAYNLCEEASSHKDFINECKALIKFIGEFSLSEEFEKRVLNLCEEIARKGLRDIDVYRNIWKLNMSFGRAERFLEIIDESLVSTYVSEKEAGEYLHLFLEYYKATKDILANEKRILLVKKICETADCISMSKHEMEEIKDVCDENGLTFYSSMLKLGMLHIGENEEHDMPHQEDYGNTFLSFLLETLDKEELICFGEMIKPWSKYFSLCDADFEVIERLINTSTTPKLWMKEEANVIAKFIICEPTNSKYWNLFRLWIGTQGSISKNILGNTLQYSQIMDGKELESSIRIALRNGLDSIAVTLTYRLMQIKCPDYVIAAQKILRQMIKKGDVAELQAYAEKFIMVIRENADLVDVSDYQWNTVCAALDVARATKAHWTFVEQFEAYLSKEYAKQGCVVVADALLAKDLALAECALKCVNRSIVTVPYKSFVADMVKKSKLGELEKTEKKALALITGDYGNALGVDDYFEFYCKMMTNDNRGEGLRVIRLLQKYIPDDVILLEMEACFLNNASTEEEYKQLYMALFKYLENIQVDNPIEYAVGRMICGEYYFRCKKVNVPSFEKLIKERYPQYLEECKKYGEFCDCILMKLRKTPHEEFLYIILSSIFKCDWQAIFEYSLEDVQAFHILNDLSTERLNIVDEYYRSYIRSVALYLIHHSYTEVDEKYARMEFLWKQIQKPGCGFRAFVEIFRQIDKINLREEISNIWGADIETITIFKKHWGKYILSQPNCMEYPEMFCVFINGRANDIFNAQTVKKQLEEKNIETAIEIAQAYENLYIRPSGPVELIQEKKRVYRDADYESNAFSMFLKKKNVHYYDYPVRCERFYQKYKLICKLNDIVDFKEANDDTRFTMEDKRKIYMARAVFYYFSVLSGCHKEEFAENIVPDFINSVSVALSNDTYALHLQEFLSHFDSSYYKAAAVLVCVAKEKMQDAYSLLLEMEDSEWKQYLAQKITASYGSVRGKQSEISKNCYKMIGLKVKAERNYWIKCYEVAQSIEKLDEYSFFTGVASDNSNDEDSLNVQEEVVSVEEEDTIAVEENAAVQEVDILIHLDENENTDIRFIDAFLQKEIEDEQLATVQSELKKLQNELNAGEDVQDEYERKMIEAGIRIIQSQSEAFDMQIMEDVMNIFKRLANVDDSMIESLRDVFQEYVCNFDTLEELCKSYSGMKDAISLLTVKRIGYAGGERNTRFAQDTNALAFIMKNLNGIVADLENPMAEEVLKERLCEYQNDLIRKPHVRFKKVNGRIVQLLQAKINRLDRKPNLVITHNGKNEKEDVCDWKEVWSNGVNSSYIRGVVHNCGAEAAVDVLLDIAINGQTRSVFEIRRIVPNEKVPFKLQFTSDDVHDGKVTWKAICTCFDEDGSDFASNVVGRVEIEYSNEDWDLTKVGYNAFDVQHPSEGEDFCGRQNELMKLRSLYNMKESPSIYPSLLVTGLRRAGKSSVMKYFAKELEQRDNIVPIFVDGQASPKKPAKTFIIEVNKEVYKRYKNLVVGDLKEFKDRWDGKAALDEWFEELPQYYEELSELLGGRKIIYFLDEVELVFYDGAFENATKEENFFGIIRSLIQHHRDNISFIFCGSDRLLTSCLEQKRESQLFQVLERIQVERMSINDIRSIFARYNERYEIQFGDSAIEAIMKYTNGLVWYTKVIANAVVDKILAEEKIKRMEVHAADVEAVVEMLIKGGLGEEKINLLDNNFGAKRKAIIRAMASIARDYNISVSIEKIAKELEQINYVDSSTGEAVTTLSEAEILENLVVLEKMDFVQKDTQRDKSYLFTTEVYRILMLNDRKIRKFLIRK